MDPWPAVFLYELLGHFPLRACGKIELSSEFAVAART